MGSRGRLFVIEIIGHITDHDYRSLYHTSPLYIHDWWYLLIHSLFYTIYINTKISTVVHQNQGNHHTSKQDGVNPIFVVGRMRILTKFSHDGGIVLQNENLQTQVQHIQQERFVSEQSDEKLKHSQSLSQEIKKPQYQRISNLPVYRLLTIELIHWSIL